jgi:hypothetical protein
MSTTSGGSSPRPGSQPVAVQPATASISLGQLADDLGLAVSQGTFDLDEIADRAGLKAFEATTRFRHGFRLARYVLLLVIAVVVLIAIYAWQTFPALDDVHVLSVPTAQQFDAYQLLRNDWFDSVKDLVQLLVVSLLVPLLATVIGFMFGRREDQAH